jgi:hypothetical protein
MRGRIRGRCAARRGSIFSPISRIVNVHAPSPGFLQIVVLASAAAILVAVVAGPFFTGALPVPARTLFWASLIGFNALKWVLWFAWLSPRLPARRQWLVPASGALILNATVPLEVAFAYRAIGLEQTPDPAFVYPAAVLVSGLIAVLVWAAAPARHAPAPAAELEPPAPATQPPRGLAARVPLESLLAVTAEDHYVRLHLANGQKPLVLYRFSDALADLGGLDGLQVHRGAWVAAGAVAGAVREGRRWMLCLGDGTQIPVSGARTAAVRARGWLREHAARD